MPLLSDQAIGVRNSAAQALGKPAAGDRAGAVIDKLIPLLGDQNDAVRASAARALGQIPAGERRAR